VLRASHRRSFDAIEDVIPGSLSLCGDLVSLDQNLPGKGVQYIDVYKWQLCTSELHCVVSMCVSATVSLVIIIIVIERHSCSF
jgi:hypothetical protein